MRTLLRTPTGRIFTAVWFGQMVSDLGTAITSFALGLWVFRETGSVTQLGTIVLAARLPMLLVSPFAGALIDRWNRRTAMIVADAGAALGTLVTAILLMTGHLEIWHLYLTLAFSGLFRAFQFPAYSAATSLLIPKDEYARAAGMVQLAGSIGRVGGPIVAGVLVTTSDLNIVFIIDFATFLFAIVTLAVVTFPEIERDTKPVRGVRGLLAEARVGLDFVVARRGLLILLLTFSAVNLAFAFQSVLLIPLLLSFTSETTAGAIVSVSAIGLVIGSLLATIWGGGEDRIKTLFKALGVMAAGLALIGLRPGVALIVIGVTVVHLAHPLAGASSQAIWQSKVPAALQGRVFAIRQVLAIATAPLAFLLAGPLADRVFEPLMGSDGGLAPVLGGLLGTGAGRGIALMFVLLGIMTGIVIRIAYRHRSIRNIEHDIPDADVEVDAGAHRH